ncbi:MAG: galactose mutarotase, partial [Bacteroidales bacterium]|nr:galactose mutarotase [Bacteroidales bacterium]
MKKSVIFLVLSLTLLSCSRDPYSVYTLHSGSLTLTVTDFGARVMSLTTPDRDGALENIVAGHKTVEEYVHPAGERFLGACVGPVANRIGGASFQVDGKVYHTPVNDNGRNTLHGGFLGVDNLRWDVVSVCDTAIVFHLLHPDGQEGYPGNLDMTMTYSLTSAGEFRVDYLATTDKATPVNFSHHPFFCLRGEGNGTVEDTPFDFREPHRIGERIGLDDEQLANARGYDHNWCIDKTTDGVEFVCRVSDPVSGRYVEVLSDQPGLQFYSGNFFDG